LPLLTLRALWSESLAQLAASSGAQNTNGTMLEVVIVNSNGTFQLTFSPPSQPVNLQGGQSETFTFTVHVTSAPPQPAQCNLTAHLTAGPNVEIVNNDVTSDVLTVTGP